MTINELNQQLGSHPEHEVRILLPDGERVPAHFHITEVGHVTKKFVDCGGTIRASEACVLQTHIGSSQDDGHRLTANKLAHILDLAKPMLADKNMSVEVEYEDELISQFPLVAVETENGAVLLRLGRKHTDCLAKDKCGIADKTTTENEAACCAGASVSGGCC